MQINATEDLLLIIDVQNDFCPGGALAVSDGDAVVPVINRLSGLFGQVALTQDWHPAGHSGFASSHQGKAPFETITMPYGPQTLWPDHCIQGTPGAAFHADLMTDKAQIIIRKGFRRGIDSYSAFFENDKTTPTGLSGFLRERGIKRVFLVGLATDFCVNWSAQDAAVHDFETIVIEDACRAIDTNNSLADALAAMNEVSATPLLARHLNDPANEMADVERAAVALGKLATPAEYEDLRTFFALYRATADEPALVNAVVAVGSALLRIGGPQGKALVERAAQDPLTQSDVKRGLSVLLTASPEVSTTKAAAKTP